VQASIDVALGAGHAAAGVKPSAIDPIEVDLVLQPALNLPLANRAIAEMGRPRFVGCPRMKRNVWLKPKLKLSNAVSTADG
jgi:hypothetical protein